MKTDIDKKHDEAKNASAVRDCPDSTGSRLVAELRELSDPTADREDADWLMADAADRIELLEERERKCKTMDEAEKIALIRALQEISDAVGFLGGEHSPRQIVERVKLLSENGEDVDASR